MNQVQKKRRLGRGLEEVADLWLSSAQIESEQHSEEIVPLFSEDLHKGITGFTDKTISFLYPEADPATKGMFISNIALELARQGLGSCLLDYTMQCPRLMENIFQPLHVKGNQGSSNVLHHVARLYGMPSIHLFSYPSDAAPKRPSHDDPVYFQIAENHLEKSIMFLCPIDTLEEISLMEEMPRHIIMVSSAHKESLLVAYAYIKSILAKGTKISIYIVMDGVPDKDKGINAFTKLNQIVFRRLSHPLEFLGSMIYDQAPGPRIATLPPLALSERPSAAKESLSHIVSNVTKFVEGPY